ncbi:MAG: hypothetical protein QM527_04130 [Alphaproteobacteria bacterium]|nr:hypothetical protein [Alphaproteobacteria bacterium]
MNDKPDASLPIAALHRLVDWHGACLSDAGLPHEWSDLRRSFGQIRKAGYYFCVQ